MGYMSIEDLKISKSVGVAGQLATDAEYRCVYPDAPDDHQSVGFVGDVYGGEVVMIMGSGAQVRVRNADRFGVFGDDPIGWTRKFLTDGVEFSEVSA